ncbi:MAG: hypothetical protein ACLBM7_09505 [Dolichospermum sp.]
MTFPRSSHEANRTHGWKPTEVGFACVDAVFKRLFILTYLL